MNLGIVIAVSNYGSLGNDLPGCKADGEAIARILQIDSKFDNVLVLTTNTNSSDVKSELIKFIDSHKENEIEDIVFYFTGHGDFDGDEFYYLLSDYDRKRRKQTSLENAELDNLLKTLNPKNAIKIVDACHSGTPYIKDPDAFDTYLKGTKGEFKKCYFMFSSQTDQYSYQDAHLSFFTKSIVESIHNHPSGIIRYKDVIDYVSDSFAESSNQTPFFIVQADFTETFISVSDVLKNSLATVLNGADLLKETIENEEAKKSLLELVQEDAMRFCSEEEAIKAVSNFIEIIKSIPLDAKVKGLYDIGYEEINDNSEIPYASSIGKWLDSNDHKFFAKPISEVVEVMKNVHKDPLRRNFGGFALGLIGHDNEDDYEWKTVKEKRITSFQSTVDLPVKLLKISVETKYPNILSAAAFIVPIISKTEMRVFFSFNFYDQDGWNGKKIGNTVKWLTEIMALKDQTSHTELTQKIIDKFSDFVYTPIAEKFKLHDSTDEDIEKDA